MTQNNEEEDGYKKEKYSGKYCKEHEDQQKYICHWNKIYLPSKDEYISTIEDLTKKWRIILSYVEDPLSFFKSYDFMEDTYYAKEEEARVWLHSLEDHLWDYYSLISQGKARKLEQQYQTMIRLKNAIKEDKSPSLILAHN